MNGKHLSIRTDRATGDMWLWNERDKRRVKNVTSDVLLALCADLFAEDGTTSMSREVRFADGATARITVENMR